MSKYIGWSKESQLLYKLSQKLDAILRNVNNVSGGGGGGGDALTTNPLSQFAATTSAQLAGVISDETGAGALVFATSPTLVTPILGAATATSINGAIITSGTLNGSVTGTNTGDQTLQAVYDDSTPSTILTDATRGALKIRRGTALDADDVLQILNGAGGATVLIRGNGSIVSGLTIQAATGLIAENSLITTSQSALGAGITSIALRGGATEPTRGGGVRFQSNNGSIDAANYIVNSQFRMGTITNHDVTIVRANSVVGTFGPGTFTTTGTIKTAGYTVATLPAGITGTIAYVTDAAAISYRATATGGGSDIALVMFDGTNWIYH